MYLEAKLGVDERGLKEVAKPKMEEEIHPRFLRADTRCFDVLEGCAQFVIIEVLSKGIRELVLYAVVDKVSMKGRVGSHRQEDVKRRFYRALVLVRSVKEQFRPC